MTSGQAPSAGVRAEAPATSTGSSVLVSRLDPAEVGVLGARQPALRPALAVDTVPLARRIPRTTNSSSVAARIANGSQNGIAACNRSGEQP